MGINLSLIWTALVAAVVLLLLVEWTARVTRRRRDQAALDRAGRIARRLPPIEHYRRQEYP